MEQENKVPLIRPQVIEQFEIEEPTKAPQTIPFMQMMRLVWSLGFTLLGDTYVNVLALRQLFVHKHQILTLEQFETLDILAQKSPGIRTIKFIFAICCYKNGFWTGVLAAVLFTLPMSVVMWVVGRHIELNRLFILGIGMIGFRGASAGILINSSEVPESAGFENVLALVSLTVVLIFPSSYIYFLIYLIAAVLSLYTKSSNAQPLKMYHMQFNRNYGLPALIIIIALMLFLWLGNRFIENSYLYLSQVLSSIIVVTTSKNTAVFPMLYGQLSLLHEISGSSYELDQVREMYMSMVGVAFVLPGPLAKMSVLVGSFFFSTAGAALAYLIPVGLSILSMCVFMTYGFEVLRSGPYRKIVTSVSCVNRGLMLHLAVEIFRLQRCDLELVLCVCIMVILWLRIYKIHRHIGIWIGGGLALSRKAFLWKYRGTTAQQLMCMPNY